MEVGALLLPTEATAVAASAAAAAAPGTIKLCGTQKSKVLATVAQDFIAKFSPLTYITSQPQVEGVSKRGRARERGKMRVQLPRIEIN